MKSLVILSLSLALSSALDYEGTDPHSLHLRLEQNHYLDFPLMRKDFTHWETHGAAVLLRNKCVLAPETRDKKGLLYSKLPNPNAGAWVFEVAFDMGNEGKTARGGTGMGVFYLKNVDQVSHKESIFGYTNRFEGLGVYVNTIMKGGEGGRKGESQTAIQGFVNDGSRPINVFSEKKHMCWRNVRNRGQPVHMRLQYQEPLLTVTVFDPDTQLYDLCFSFETPSLSFPGHFLLSGSSGVHNPDHVYIHSLKLYDPKTPANNDHFQEARHTKAERENEGKREAKDLFEHHSEQDLASALSGITRGAMHVRDPAEMMQSVPIQHNKLTHKVQEVLTQVSVNNDLFFETMRGIPQLDSYNQLNDKLFAFRLRVDQVNQLLDTDLKKLSTFDKSLKTLKHTNNLQKGLLQREVNNQHTKKLQYDLQEVERMFQQITVQFKDYQQAMEALGSKVRREAGFTQKLEDERRQFAKEMSGRLVYDMGEIDEVFNEMEVAQVGGWGNTVLNIGMGLVIAVSAMLWVKMNKFETKNE